MRNLVLFFLFITSCSIDLKHQREMLVFSLVAKSKCEKNLSGKDVCTQALKCIEVCQDGITCVNTYQERKSLDLPTEEVKKQCSEKYLQAKKECK